jgi:endonuclease/exonuclease/phosphatase family metal-dependent hydrolase
MTNTIVKSENAEFRIMTSNIWGNCGDNMIANRDDLLAGIFISYMPDVLGLQEVSPKSRDEKVNIFDLLETYYAEVEVDIGQLTNNYTPLLYLKDEYSVVDSGFYNYSGLNDKNSKSVTWAVMERSNSGKRFAVCNTHFYWKSDDAGREARINNSGELLQVVNEILERHRVPIFCIGDFNCSVSSDPAQILFSRGFADTQSAAIVRTSDSNAHHPYPTWDETTETFINGPAPTGVYARAIDHIYYTGEHVNVWVYDTIVSQDALDASDHCPVYVDISLSAAAQT